MIKKLRYLFTLMLLLVASVGWAEEVTFTAGTDTGDTSVTKDGVTVSMSTMSRTDNYRTYANADMTVSSETATITKIEITCTASGTSNYGPGKFSGNGYSYSGNVGTWTGSSNSVTLSASAQVRITKIVVTYTPSGAPTLQDPGFSFSAETAEAVVGEAFTAPTFSNPNNIDVTFASSNTSVATVNDAGAVTIVGAGTTEISATSEANDTYKAGEASYTLTVTEPLPTGTIFYESFNTNEGTGGNDDNWGGSIATNDFKSDNEGWVTENANGANHCVKAGNSSKKGSLTTPEIPFETGKNYVLTFKAGAWNKSGEGTTLSLSASSASISVETVTMVMGQWTEYTVYINNVTGAGTISFYTSAGNNRFFLDEVMIAESNVVVPSISANDVQIAYDATSGEIEYTIENPVEGTTLAATTTAEWISNVTVAADKVTFTTTANTEPTPRDGVITLTYGEVTKDVTVTQNGNPDQPGTEAKPYTVAQARAAIDAGTGTSGVYATGIVSEIVTAYNSQFGNISYNISDDGSTTSNQLQAYRGKSYNGENFTSEDDIQVGDVVVVYGNLKKYNSTYEFDANNQLVSLTRSDVAVPTFTPEAGVYYEAQNVTIACETEGATIKYSTDNATWADYTTPIAVAETTTIYAKAVNGTSESIVASAKYEIRDANVKGSPSNPYTVSEVLEGEASGKTSVYVVGYIVGEFASGSNSGGNNENTIKTSDFSGDTNIALADEFTKTPAVSGSIPVQIPQGDLRGVWGLKSNPDKVGYKVLVKGDGDTYFSVNGVKGTTEIIPIAVTVTISSAATDGKGNYYGTMYYSDKNLVVPTGAVAETYKVEGGALTVSKTYDEGSVIPQGTGVVIKTSAAGNFDFAVTTAEGEGDADNMLEGTDEQKTIEGDGKYYMLSRGVDENGNPKANSIGFYFDKNSEGGTKLVNKAHKAYLVVPGGEAKGYPFGGDATGIEGLNVNDNVNANEVYDLQGRKLQGKNLPKGIYIVNGKKVVIK